MSADNNYSFNSAAWLASLETPRREVSNDPYQKEWAEGFQRYIYVLTAILFTTDKTRQLATSESNMKIWARAFRDPTFASDNYEELEILGDKVAGYAFVKFIRHRNPNASSAYITNLGTYYLARDFQAAMATKLKLLDWLLLGSDIRATIASKKGTESLPVKLKGDVLESFVGALTEVAGNVRNSLLDDGDIDSLRNVVSSGPDMVEKFTFVYFTFIDKIDETRGQVAAKTQLGTIAATFGRRNEVKYYATSRAQSDTLAAATPASRVVEISSELAASISDYVKGAVPKVLFRGDNVTENESAEGALRFLASEFSITEEWIKEIKETIGTGSVNQYSLEELKKRYHGVYPKFLFMFPHGAIGSSVAAGADGVELNSVNLIGVSTGRAGNRGGAGVGDSPVVHTLLQNTVAEPGESATALKNRAMKIHLGR